MAEFIFHILIEKQLRKGGTNEIFLKKLASYYYRVVSCKTAAVLTDGLCSLPASPLLPQGLSLVDHLPDYSPTAGVQILCCVILFSGPGVSVVTLSAFT